MFKSKALTSLLAILAIYSVTASAEILHTDNVRIYPPVGDASLTLDDPNEADWEINTDSGDFNIYERNLGIFRYFITDNTSLDVFQDDGFYIGNYYSPNPVQLVLGLGSNVPPQQAFMNGTSGAIWYFAMTADDQFKISRDGTGRVEMKIFSSGNVSIAGSLSQGSDRNSKINIEQVDTKSILDTVLQLPISTWEYKTDLGVKHMGPMGQDFHGLFDLGESPTRISSIDTGGVAIAAIQGLNQVVLSKDKEIDTLERENELIRSRLDRLEKQLQHIIDER